MKARVSRISVFTLVLFLSACAMGPDYERPEVPVPAEYAEEVIPGASIANLSWWGIVSG